MFQLSLYPADQEVEVCIRLVEINQFLHTSNQNESNNEEFISNTSNQGTVGTNNTDDKRIVDEQILLVQGETSFEFTSIQSEASILSIEVQAKLSVKITYFSKNVPIF